MRGDKGRTPLGDLGWEGLSQLRPSTPSSFTLSFHLQVAIKIIDKTQLNPSSLQKVRPRERAQGGDKVEKRVIETAHPHLSLSSFLAMPSCSGKSAS